VHGDGGVLEEVDQLGVSGPVRAFGGHEGGRERGK
jgi:hypothetical protein